MTVQGGIKMKRRSLLALLLAFVMCVTMLASCGGDKGTSDSTGPVKIGILGPLTGGVAEYGIAVRD